MASRRLSVSHRRLLLACASAWLLASCAQDVGLVDRVQPGALHKDIFKGEWYFQRTVVDVPYTVGYTFIGETEDLERVRWEIHEDRLVAYRSYDFIDNTDLGHSSAAKPGETVTGQPIAVYEIVGHFDVQREYSPATGEQSNVLVENSEDRPWYERSYIRVNWANNAATNFNFTVDDIPTESVQFAITDPSDPDAFTMGWRDATRPTGWKESRDPTRHREARAPDYLDFVTKILAKPEKFEWFDPWSGGESWPACWFYLNFECKTAEIEIRTALLRLPEKDDYQPLEYPDNYIARTADGKPIRVVERSTALPKNNQNYQYRHYRSDGIARDPKGHVLRVPMFDKFGYFRVERYGYDNRYGEVESARRYYIGRFNIWDKSTDADGKPIPYPERKVRPIVYYLGQGFPKELHETAVGIVKSWDEAFRATVAALQGSKPDEVAPVFVLKDNTLAFDAEGNMTDRGQRVGDIRYSLLNLVEEPTRAGLLGYGPNSTDPVTGQVISGAAHAYGGPLREYATLGRDIVRLSRGDISAEEFGLGEVGEEEVKKHLHAFASGSSAGAKTWDAQAAEGKRAAWVKETQAFAKKKAGPAKRKEVLAMRKKFAKLPQDFAQKRLAAIRGSKLEDRLITRDVALAFGSPEDKANLSKAPPGTPMPPLTQQQRDMMSPAAWASMGAKLGHVKRWQTLSRHNIYHKSFADDAVLGLVETLKDKDPDEVWKEVFTGVFRSTAEHEVGHTLGLRHNFEASTDALNFSDSYWKLRTMKPPKPLDFDTLSPEQKKAGVNDKRYSSIMDYHARFHTDLAGLGRYDAAAIAFGYGQLVEVWDDTAAKSIRENGMFDVIGSEIRRQMGEAADGKPQKTSEQGVWVGDPKYGSERDVLDTALRGLIHYTALPQLLGSAEGIGARKLVPYADVIAEMSGAASGKPDQPVKPKLFEVPYRFCSDEYTMGTPTCNVYDEGVDAAEIVDAALDQWRDYYFINAFRRDRVDFDLGYYYFRVWFRYFHPVIRQYQYWVFDMADPDDVTNPGSLWDTIAEVRPADAGMKLDGDGFGPYWTEGEQGGLSATAAVREGIKRIAAAVAVPEPGNYCLDTVTGRYDHAGLSTSVPVCKKVESCYVNESGSCVDSKDCKAMFGADSQCVWDVESFGRFCGAGCTKDDQCPSGYSCYEMQSLENTWVKVCALDDDSAGSACTASSDCSALGWKDSACVKQAAGLGPFCGKACQTKADCPARHDCVQAKATEGASVKQCVTVQETGCADLVVPVGDGRYSFAEYDYDTGYYFYERLKYAGSFYDKLAALEVLTDPTTYFIDTDVSEPIRNYVVSTFWFFREELMRYLGGLAAGKQEMIAYRVDDKRQLVPPDLFSAAGAAATGDVVPVPNMFNLRPYTSYLGMALLNTDWDQTFNDSSKIWLDGANDAIDPPAGVTVVSFYNPLNQRVYKAMPMGDANLFSIGLTMVEDAEKLGQAWAKNKDDWGLRWDLEYASQHIEIVRGLYDIYGYFWW